MKREIFKIDLPKLPENLKENIRQLRKVVFF